MSDQATTTPAQPKRIIPTVGRVILVLHNGIAGVRPALITYVWSDTCVNANVLLDQNDNQGTNLMVTSIQLYASQDDAMAAVSPKEAGTSYAGYWMPYQIGQAAKSEDLAGKLEQRLSVLEDRGEPYMLRGIGGSLEMLKSGLELLAHHLGDPKAIAGIKDIFEPRRPAADKADADDDE